MTPLMLLPGMMCDQRLFGQQVEALSDRFEIIHGVLDGHDTVEDLAAHLLKTAPPRFALAGLSMGGIVAMEIMAQAPERVSKLCLMDTNPLAEVDAVKEMREPQIQKAQNGQLRSVMRDEMKPRYLTDGPKRDEILDLCMEMAMDLGAEVFVRQSRALQSRPDQTRTLKQVEVPTLILCGADDTLCPLERHQLMQSLIADSKLAVVEHAGHLPVLENPHATNQLLDLWLTE